MTWKFNGETLEEAPEGYCGFVYLIVNITNNKKYVGKKLLSSSRRVIKSVKLKSGIKKKKKVRIVKESDWKEYYGSSDALKLDIELLGKELFTREILYLCKSKAECSYRESWEIFNRNCLLSDEYYNSWCSVRIRKDHIIGKIK